MTGNEHSRPNDYWDRKAGVCEFSHPLDKDRMRELVFPSARILDYGCGYGRTCAELLEMGFTHVTGADTSTEMIVRGRREHPDVDFRLISGSRIPFEDAYFDAALLFAVLTCVPADAGQETIVKEISRVLRSGGILYVSDYPLQDDDRNLERYRKFRDKYHAFGIFELEEGVVMRHHAMDWIEALLSPFERLALETIEAKTMMGHQAKIFQYFGRKP